MPFTLIKQEKRANECVFLGGDRWEANMLYITWPSPSKAPWDTSSSSLTEADRSNLNRICYVHTKGSSLFFFFFLLLVSFFSRCGWCDDWDIQGNTHPTYEALRVPERVESWYVVFQDGLTAALTAWRKQSQEALLAVLLAVTVMEACWRNGSNSFKCFFQYMLNSFSSRIVFILCRT